MPIDRTSHLKAHKPDQNSRHRSFYRSFIQFLCSNIGLILVVIAYSIGGAFLFILLEQYIEIQNCQQATILENVSVSNISESMYNYVIISNVDTNVMYEQMVSYLENFTNDIYDRETNFHYTGQDCITGTKWTFPSALLFTITVITTIGYGYVTPISWEGQITCICYALIGIPIFLLCLANISSILADMFRFLYSTLLHCICCCCRIYARSRRPKRTKKSANSDGIEYVGNTSMDPSWPEAHPSVGREKFHYDNDDDDDDDDDNVDDEIYDVYSRMESRVPILAVISIIIGYICLGAIMFNYFEGWSMTISVYFCYITLSTIGFGDYVPGITSSSTSGLRFLSACLYIIIGLAILAMCFDLMKESIVDKFAWMAQKLGFVSEDEDQVDKDPSQYVDFQYSQSPGIQMNKSFDRQSPPAYDYTER